MFRVSAFVSDRPLPVVASRVGGVPDLITDGVDGILVEPRDPQALVRALERLCRDADLRNRLGRSAEERAGDFDIETGMRRIEAVYTSLVTGGVGSPGKSGLTPPAP